MTRIGAYLQSRAVNRAELARQTGISTSRLYQLSSNKRSKLGFDEFYLISLALKVDQNEMIAVLGKDLKLKKK